jgi:hypothetical protein
VQHLVVVGLERGARCDVVHGGRWRAACGVMAGSRFIAGAAPALASKERRLNAAVRRRLGRCARQGDGERTGGQ